jgi:hypothetical protein
LGFLYAYLSRRVLEGTRRVVQRDNHFLLSIFSFLLLDSTFCLDTKGGAKKSRQFDALLFLGCIISPDELPIAAVMLFGQSIGAIAKLRAMLGFLGALLFCADALRKIKTAPAHKAKALDHILAQRA